MTKNNNNETSQDNSEAIKKIAEINVQLLKHSNDWHNDDQTKTVWFIRMNKNNLVLQNHVYFRDALSGIVDIIKGKDLNEVISGFEQRIGTQYGIDEKDTFMETTYNQKTSTKNFFNTLYSICGLNRQVDNKKPIDLDADDINEAELGLDIKQATKLKKSW